MQAFTSNGVKVGNVCGWPYKIAPQLAGHSSGHELLLSCVNVVFNQIFLSSGCSLQYQSLYPYIYTCITHALAIKLIHLLFSKIFIQEGTSKLVVMGVLNWMQTKLHGSHSSRRKSEFSADSAQLVDTSSGLPQTDEINDGWTTAMLSIGTFGMREGHGLKSCGRFDELSKLEELKSLVRGRGADTVDELPRCSSSSKNGGIVRQRSLRKPATRAFGGFLPKPSFRETVPEVRFNEIVWGLLLKNAHPENSAFGDPAMRDDRAVQKGRKCNAEAEDEAGKWIRTDSEYIVLEI
ncbi:unnamed protein product [Urochloa humidicola]